MRKKGFTSLVESETVYVEKGNTKEKSSSISLKG